MPEHKMLQLFFSCGRVIVQSGRALSQETHEELIASAHYGFDCIEFPCTPQATDLTSSSSQRRAGLPLMDERSCRRAMGTGRVGDGCRSPSGMHSLGVCVFGPLRRRGSMVETMNPMHIYRSAYVGVGKSYFSGFLFC